MMIVFFSILLAAIVVYAFVAQPKFGRMPFGKRLEEIEKSPNYRNGEFQNTSPTPNLTEGANLFSVMFAFFFGKDPRNKPSDVIPSVKTDLFSLGPDEDVLVWFGHSSYFIQVDGKKILVDPVFSGAASPIKATTRSFPGTDVYTTDDFPEIDYLILSHDHWDHLDYETVLKLKPKTKTVICGLGVGAHMEHWGFDPEIIIEKDWDETIDLGNGFVVNTTPARHFSGRGFKRNRSLWMSFILTTPDKRIYLGGDSGYDSHFKEIGENFGPFDLAVLECGQYNKNWKYIHLLPEDFIKAAKDLNARHILPVHWGKFALAIHAWDEPIKRVSEMAQLENLSLLTPMIGEKLNLNAPQSFKNWWENVN